MCLGYQLYYFYFFHKSDVESIVKDHPRTSKIGRFRPIRYCSNVIKLFESLLLPKLMEWGNKNLSHQFGFMIGLACEEAQTIVFNKMLKYKKSHLAFILYKLIF
jgi:hypothetical protein